ncbi:hypothetical protein BDZ45DRAFT_676978 [Acephala macrosclerotiorum]|nr:hypothetical protein BDZ45DRAFT_676978 [Acephala macrosclerotiorum]
MSLQAVYKQFLAAPNSALLASNASLHYITTLVTINGSSEIIKHLNSQTRELKKKEEKYLDVVEGSDALAVELHTTIEFVFGGGAYLPALDDNFLADRVVTFPIIHMVSFDADGKIQQIRQSWDQGSLLKLIDVIGKTGRNWPIRDGKDQIKLIINSVKSSGKTLVDGPPPPTAEEAAYNRSRGNSTHVTRDPHASLSLFAPRGERFEDPLPTVMAPKSSAKPPPRDINEIFGVQTSPVEPERSESPSRIAPKVGAGKNYGPSRLFDAESAAAPDPKTEKMYRPSAARYQHFDFGDGEEAEKKKKPVDATKHSSQWKFDDFMTPQKPVPSKVLRTNDVRHWGNSDDEVADSPVKAKKVDKPRPSAETHFEFEDDGTSEDGPRLVSRPRGAGQNNGLGLYKDNLFDEETGAAVVGNDPVPTLANVKDRRKDFDPHFAMTDDSPASKPAAQHVPDNRAKVVKMMDANWDTYDQSPNQKENHHSASSDTTKSMTIAGDGMGGKKGPLSEATNIMSHRNDNPKGINTAGDGMGGKKGSGRLWGFGDDSDGEESGDIHTKAGKFRTGKTQGKQQATGGDFWDF